MNYSLALELKNAGFPQNKDGDGTFLCECSHLSKDPEAKTVLGDTHERAYVPTLEELIEACVSQMVSINKWGDNLNFFELSPNINSSGDLDKIGKISEWRATWSIGISLDFIKISKNYFGSTPSEAVARLWLALNKK